MTVTPNPPITAGAVLRLIREGRATTRNDLATLLGAGRTTIAQRVDALLATRLVHEAGAGASTGGRRPTVLAFSADTGVVLSADLGATHCRLAITDLDGQVLTSHAGNLDIARGPNEVLSEVVASFRRILGEIGMTSDDVLGIGLGVPGPVEFATGRPANPPIMPGWDGFSVPDWFASVFPGVPVVVDNDVNIMALGEYARLWKGTPYFLMVKVGTGIGGGIIVDGQVRRGAQGAAGDIGHVQMTGQPAAMCRCGNVGCLEALAGGGAMAQRLAEAGYDVQNARQVVELVRQGNQEATQMIRQSGRLLGQVLAGVVNFLNPNVIIIGGDVAESEQQLLAGVREIVYRRSLPLATQHLRIARSELGDHAGVIGAAEMAIERVLADDVVDRLIDGISMTEALGG